MRSSGEGANASLRYTNCGGGGSARQLFAVSAWPGGLLHEAAVQHTELAQRASQAGAVGGGIRNRQGCAPLGPCPASCAGSRSALQSALGRRSASRMKRQVCRRQNCRCRPRRGHYRCAGRATLTLGCFRMGASPVCLNRMMTFVSAAEACSAISALEAQQRGGSTWATVDCDAVRFWRARWCFPRQRTWCTGAYCCLCVPAVF